jgi:hypothetical protein
MSCDNDWTIRFEDVGGSYFEVRPVTMSLTQSRDEYSFFRAKLPWEVGVRMKPHTSNEDGLLRGLTPVTVLYNGKSIAKLLFRPDWVDYRGDFTHLQLHDRQKALADGLIDISRTSIQLKDIYKKVLNAASNRIIDTVRFTVPDGHIRTVYGKKGMTSQESVDGEYKNRVFAAGLDKTQRVIDSLYAADFDNISPEKALARLNKKFRLKTWLNRQGELVVGLPEANNITHLAAPRDERVWRYKNPQISHNREPIKSVAVEGAWVDEPGFDPDPTKWFDKGGMADVKAYGIAHRTDVDEGTTFSVSSTKAKKDALPHIAQVAIEERIKQSNSGSVEIDPNFSGSMVSDVIDLRPGDRLHLVPRDELFDNPTATSGKNGDFPDNMDEMCGDFVNNETYLVTEVEHSVQDGNWTVHADLTLVPDIQVKSFMTYFSPQKEKWVKASQINDDGSLSGSWWDIEDI